MNQQTLITLNKNLTALKKNANNPDIAAGSLNGEENNCVSAISPLAYLADLLDYAIQHIKKEGVALSIADLEKYFHQPFGQIPLNCEAVEEEVSQIRICVEVLRQHFKDQSPSNYFTTTAIRYLNESYQNVLFKLGTSPTELQEMATMDAAEQEEKMAQIAGRLGIDPSHALKLWKGDGELTEAWLAEVFGLKNTQEIVFTPIEASLLTWQKAAIQQRAEDRFEADDFEAKAEWLQEHFQQAEENYRKIITETEEVSLPVLRQAYITSAAQARALSNQLLISCEYDACFRTTRVSQAITTIQQLITAVRTGLLKDTHPELTLHTTDFSEEWKWLGTYKSWRAAMMVFLYPENVLDPSLNSNLTPFFKGIMNKSRKNRNFSRVDADKLVDEYQVYFQDLSDMEIEASCSSTYTEGAENSIFLQFGRSNGKIYMAIYEDGEQGSWELVPEYFDKEFKDQYGTYVYQEVMEISAAMPLMQDDNKRYICLFFRVGIWVKGEEIKGTTTNRALFLMKYDLEKREWLTGSRPLPTPRNNGSTLVVEKGNDERHRPRIYLYYGGSLFINVLDGHIYNFANQWREVSFLYSIKDAVKFGNHRFVFVEKGANVELLELWDDVAYEVHKTNIILTNRSSLGATLGKDHVYWFTKYNVNGTIEAHKIIKGPYLSVRKSLPSNIINFSNHAGLTKENEVLSFRAGYKTLEQNRHFQQHAFFKEADNSLPLQEIIKVSLPTISNLELNSDPSTNRKAIVEASFTNISSTDTYILQHLWEAYYFLPMYVALKLQMNRQYNDAKDYFKLVFDYGAIEEETKVFYGLTLEESINDNFQRDNEWLLDPLDPHAIAQTRKNAYTDYTIMSIARCFLKEADAFFTLDTVEGLDHARNLYISTLELLNSINGSEELANTVSLKKATEPSKVLSDVIENRNQLKNNTFKSNENVIDKSSTINTFTFIGNMLLSINSLAFSVPENLARGLLKMHAEINLTKLNTCRNIAGDKRQNSSLSITNYQILNTHNGFINTNPLSSTFRPTPFRYVIIIERAKQLTNLAQQIESSFLSTLEKLDAEQLNQLNAGNELLLSKAGIQLQDMRLISAKSNVALSALQTKRSEIQHNHFQGLLNAGLSGWEIAGLVAQTSAVVSSGGAVVAGIIKAVVSFGKSWGEAASSGATHSSYIAGLLQTQASYERRREDWELQRNLSDQDILIGEQQQRIAKDQVDVVNQERNIALLRSDQAETVAEFLTNKFTNAELYDWMSEVLEGVYSFFLQQATATAQLAAQQLAFERQEPVPAIISADYWEAPRDNFSSPSATDMAVDRRGLTGSARLLQDIYQLDQFALQTDRRKLQLTKTISLASLSPIEFQQFRDTGSLSFYTPMELFDRDFPGHYLRLIKRIRVSVIALAPPIDGIKATLWSNGISRTVQSINNVFTTTEIKRMPENIALTGALNASGIFDFDTDQSKLLPFESMGVDNAWEFQLPKASNLSLDYNAIADVLITIDYTALYSDVYKQQVLEQLDRTFMADRVYSFRNDFPDQWYDLHHPELVEEANQMTVHFDLLRADFPPNVMDLKVKHITLYLPQDDYPNLAISLNREGKSYPYQNKMTPNGIASSRQTDNFPGRWDNMLGVSPEGQWTLGFPDNTTVRQWFKADRFKDILLVITYEGDFA